MHGYVSCICRLLMYFRPALENKLTYGPMSVGTIGKE